MERDAQAHTAGYGALDGLPPNFARSADAALMGRIAQGDREAFGDLVERHKDPLVAYLSRLAGSPAPAEDLAQETFLRLFEAAPRYREEGNLKAFLYRIATNLLRTQQRQEHRRRMLLSTFAFALPFSGGDGDGGAPSSQPGLREVLATEAQRQVADAVARLPLRYRVPLVLAEVEGWKQEDIAALMECRPGTVKSRIHRAKQRLREALAPYWSSP